MAVDARHLNFFLAQLIGNREIMNASNNGNTTQMGLGVPLSGITTDETFLPPLLYNSVMTDSVPATTTMKAADSGLTNNNNLTVSRKRSRETTINPLIGFPTVQKDNDRSTSHFLFLGEDISLQVQQQEIDCIIAQHTENVRLELSEHRKQHSKQLLAAVEEGIAKRLRAKEEEIEKIRKLNWVLEERMKSLYLENQIWRNLAQTNEATANALRSNLEQVMAQINEECCYGGGETVADDVESCCGSNSNFEEEEEERRTLAVENEGRNGNRNPVHRLCRNCWKEESCVLLLPCRHLCLCMFCGSKLHTCPICKSTKNASIHVNLS